MTLPPDTKRPSKWTLLVIIAVLFAVMVPIAYKFGQGMARDGMDKALEEKARMDAQRAPNLTARNPLGERKQVSTDTGGTVVWYEIGDGAPVVMFASAGREASDFNELAETLAGAGYRSVIVEAPEINGAKTSRPEQPTMFTLAEDAKVAIDAQSEPVVVLGHAFGNRLARATATAYPDEVRGVILIAAGGPKPVPEKANKALFACFDSSLPVDERREQVRYGFFANDNEIPDYWMRGWHIKTAQIQGKASRTDIDRWVAGGEGAMLVIAGMQDTIAPPEDTIDLLEADYPDRVTAVHIENASHALLPEQPELIAKTVIEWLGSL